MTSAGTPWGEPRRDALGMNPGDEVIFFGTRYTLIERTGMFGWLAVATDDAKAKPRIILDEYLKEAPSRTP